MEEWNLVRKLLGKFSVKDLLTKVSNLEIFSREIDEIIRDFGDAAKKKNELLDTYLELLRENVESKVAIGHLSLFYTYLHSSQKIWRVYEFLEKEDNEELLLEPPEYKEKLEQELKKSSLNPKTVVVQLYDGGYWLRISIIIKNKRKRNEEFTIFGVHYEGCNCIALNSVAKPEVKSFLKVLGRVLNFGDVRETGQTDRSVIGILKLFYEKENPNYFELGTTHPLATKELVSNPEEIIDECINNLQKNRSIKRQKYIQEKFGLNEPPPIKKLVYELHAPFAGLEDAPQMEEHQNENFICRLEFDGTNVIDGLQKLVTSGIATEPYPNYIANIRVTGKTKFLIRHKN